MGTEIADRLAELHRREWAYVLSATVRVTRDIDLAEECVQDAFARALTTWSERGVPDNPSAWLAAVARNRALDLIRRAASFRTKMPLLVEPEEAPEPTEADAAAEQFPDDRLRLVFTCCHPSLPSEAQVALTLRLLCGLSTAEVARAFLVSEPTMAARITRAKKKIAAAGIPYRVPEREDLPERVDAVLSVLHLLFTTGHTAPTGADLVRRDLVARARELTRMVYGLLPQPEVAGLLALILLTDARSATRVGDDGRLLMLDEQDRTQWDHAAIQEGRALVIGAMRTGAFGRFTLQAAIAAAHADARTWEETDWESIVALYTVLQARWPSPVVALNRAVAIGLAQGPQAGLDALDAVAGEPHLAGYAYLPSARADFLRRLGRDAEAAAAYDAALALTDNAVEREFLERRRAAG
jgi:RNA polymerase sigma factor (sigma-70 family)